MRGSAIFETLLVMATLLAVVVAVTFIAWSNP